MKRRFFPGLVVLALCVFSICPLKAQLLPKRMTLPNGWSLSPAGTALPLGDLPLNIALSKNKKYAAVVNCGQSVHSLQLFDAFNQRQLDSVVLPKAWYGLVFTDDARRLYVSGANDNMIRCFQISQNKLLETDSIVLGDPWPNKISPAGMALEEQRNLLYVVTKENSKLYIINTKQRKAIDSLPLGGEGYTCILSPDKKELYVTCWGCDVVKVMNTRTRKWTADIKVGDNPNEIISNAKGNFLFVSNANDNSVSVIDVRRRKVVETLNAALYADAPPGSTTNGLALSPDESTLYAANADNNCLAVFDVRKPGQSMGLGFVPVGWYPTAVRFVNGKLWVANGKGFHSMPNPQGPNPLGAMQSVGWHTGDERKPMAVQYIAGLLKGSLSVIQPPNEKTLKHYTQAVYANTPYSKQKEETAEGVSGHPVPRTKNEKSRIKYVFYVIKENRTYDQVLADVPGGNGDTSLLLFGERYTPNQHLLVKNFVLLDNFFVDAEVSADGHNWSMGAYATDYLEKTWPTSYGKRGGKYDAEGNRSIANNKNGFIWDACKRAGVSYRSYGEFADDYKPNIAALNNHFCPYFTGYNTGVKDTTRFYQWRRDFDSLLAIGQLPQFNTVRFGNDHTDGLKKGRPTPFAHVADNDLAVGLFIQHLARSPIWNETAVFILEDDAQNGADHVDAHRSTAYLAGGFVKRGFVDHTPYTTTSMLRTMELILGLSPMSQYDAAAIPMWRCFDTVSKPYVHPLAIPEVDLNSRNTVSNQWQQISEGFVLDEEDANDDVLFNTVLWHAVKGDKPFPGPRRAAFVKTEAKEDD